MICEEGGGGGCGEGGHDSPTFDSNIFTCLLICRKIFLFWWNCEKKSNESGHH